MGARWPQPAAQRPWPVAGRADAGFGGPGRASAVLSREARGDAPERTQPGIAMTRILSPCKKELRSEAGARMQN